MRNAEEQNSDQYGETLSTIADLFYSLSLFTRKYVFGLSEVFMNIYQIPKQF